MVGKLAVTEIPRREGYQSLTRFKPRRDEKGRRRCVNCDAVLTGRRIKYCSDKCGYEFWTKHHWPTLRVKMIWQSKFTCAHCGFHLEKKGFSYECIAPKNDSRIYYRYDAPYSQFVVDHVVPIFAGGPEFDEENLQVLCIPCNKKKTREDLRKYHQFVKAYGIRKITEFC